MDRDRVQHGEAAVVDEAGVVIRPLGRPGDLGWVVMAHGELYAGEFGWDASFEALVAGIVTDYGRAHDPNRETAWIAELDGRRVGCVFCVAADERTAQLRILLVHPDARGRGVGARLTRGCVEFARAARYERMRLWTNHPLWRPAGSTSRPASPSSNRARITASGPT